MKRRTFLQNSSFIATPFILGGQKVFANNEANTTPKMMKIAQEAQLLDKILVIVQMNGGNDGLNMVIPLDSAYDKVKSVRTTIMMAKEKVLALSGVSNVGLHPAMTGLQSVYNAGKMRIVQGVSYPNPNSSHFRSQDIFFTGSPSNVTYDTGWLGRALDIAFPGYPEGYPSTSKPHPPAIQIGGTLPILLQAENLNMGYNVPTNGALLQVLNPQPANDIDTDYELELDFLRIMKEQSNAYASVIGGAYTSQATQSTKYATSGNSLSDQLKTVARLIGGGLTTPVYIVNHPNSFDTHINQVDSDPTTGSHANMLSLLSVAITAFLDDLALMGKANKVLGMTFSEFGRRVSQNSSTGTDHGQGAPVMFFGETVQPGVEGTTPVLPPTITVNTQVPTQYDFRGIYSTVLQQWLGYTAAEANSTVFQNPTLNPTTNALIFEPAGTLPIQGFTITAKIEKPNTKISFKIYDNTAQDYYLIDRSTNGSRFENVGKIINTADGDVMEYEFLDTLINAPSIYYRVTAVGKSGKKVNSKIIYIENTAAQKISIYPNPIVNNYINIELFEKFTGQVRVEILNSTGIMQTIDSKKITDSKTVSFQLEDMFQPEQLYLARVTYGHKQSVEKITFK